MPILALHVQTASHPGFGAITEPGVADGPPIARVWQGNPIAGNVPIPPLVGDLVCWSGWCGETAPGGVVRADVRTWTATGWDAFERVAKELDEAAVAAGVDVVLRPHARHVLADPQSTLAWLRRASPSRLKILLDPAGWLTPSMLDTAPDHLARAFESFAGHPAVWGTVLTGVVRVEVEDADLPGGELVACPMGDEGSVLDPRALLGSIGGYPLTDRPIVLPAEGFELARARLAESLGAGRV